MVWEVGAPFGLTSLKLLAVLVGGGLVCIVVLLRRLHKREKTTLVSYLVDAGLYGAAVLLPVAAVLFQLNRMGGFYNSFADLVLQIQQLP